MRSSEDAIGIASSLLGRELGVERVMYGEVDDERNTFFVPRDWKRSGTSNLSGNTFPIEAFGAEVAATGRAGEVIAITDVRADPRTVQHQQAYLTAMGVTASLLVPLVSRGACWPSWRWATRVRTAGARPRSRWRAAWPSACGPRSTWRAPRPPCAKSATAAS